MNKTKNLILQFCQNLINHHYDVVVSKETVDNIQIILDNLSVNNPSLTEEVIKEVDMMLMEGDRPESKDSWLWFFALSIGNIIVRDLEIQALTKLQEEFQNGKATSKD